MREQDLQRNLPSELKVFGQVDDADAATADYPLDPMSREHSTGLNVAPHAAVVPPSTVGGERLSRTCARLTAGPHPLQDALETVGGVDEVIVGRDRELDV